MIRELVKYDHPAMNEPAEPFDFEDEEIDPVELAHDLAQTMIMHSGVGLAAPQIGVPVRALALTGNPVIVMFNPKIVNYSETTNVMEEACLSYPGLTCKVERSVKVRVRYQTPAGEVKTEEFTGMTARIVQHEVDHLDGKSIIDSAGGLRSQMAKKKWINIVKKTGGIPVSFSMEKSDDRIQRP